MKSTFNSITVIAILLISCSAGLLLCEFYLKITDFLPSYRHENLILKLDPDLLYKIKPNCRNDINSLGFRDYEFPEKSSKERILFLGDSFVMGNNVESGNTFPKRTEKLLGKSYECFNLGVVGYGPDQSLVQLLKTGPELQPDIVVLSLFPANDFNDLYKNKMLSFDSQGKVYLHRFNLVSRYLPKYKLGYVANKILSGSFLYDNLDKKIFQYLLYDDYDLLFESHDNSNNFSMSAGDLNKVNLMKALLSYFKALSEKNKFRLLVLIIPSYETVQDSTFFKNKGISENFYFFNESVAANICEQFHMDSIDLSKILLSNAGNMPYDPDDHHLSEYGNLLVAQEVTRHILSR